MKKQFEIDGVVREFDVPDDATDEEILEFVNSEVPPPAQPEPQKRPGYGEQVATAVGEAWKPLQRTMLQTGDDLQTINQGGTGGSIGRSLGRIGRMGLTAYEFIPEAVGAYAGTVGALAKPLAAPIGRAINRGMEQVGKAAYAQGMGAPQQPEQPAPLIGNTTLGAIGSIGNWMQSGTPEQQAIRSATLGYAGVAPFGRVAMPAVKSAAGKASTIAAKTAEGVAKPFKEAAGSELPDIAKKIINPVRNERGEIKITPKKIDEVKADEIADIEAIEAGIEPPPMELEAMGPSSAPVVAGKEIKQIGKDKPKKPFLSGIKDGDAFTLNTPEDGEVITFDKLAKTQADMMDPRNKGTKPMPSAMDQAGSLGVKAWKKVKELRQQVGKKYDEELGKAQQAAYESGVLFQGQPVREKWAEIVQKYFNADITPEGKVVAKFGEGQNVTDTDIRKLEQITKAIGQTGDAVFPKEYVSLSQKVMALVKQANANLPINSRVQGAGKEFAGFVDNYTEEVLGPEFKEASQKYRKLRTLETALSKRLGDVVDPDKEIARHGASLLKSAIMSNADRGGKVMFDEIKKLTGIDLYRTANYAKIAMEATGDHRIFDLLKETGTISGIVSGNPIASAAANVGMKKVKQKFDENLLANMVNYYNKSQGRALKPAATPQSGTTTIRDLLKGGK